MTYKIISTGSKGNAVVINDAILIDCGVPYKRLEPVAKGLKLVLLTHIHGDHFKPKTVVALHRERPTLRFGCCVWMVEPLLDAGVDSRMIDVFQPGVTYVYGARLEISPVALTHNVHNCGYRIRENGEDLFYATDTGTLDGIEAKGYDLYLVEANHTKADLEARMEKKLAEGKFSYEIAAAQNHLSREQAEDWLYQQMGPNSRYAFLHQHIERSTINA